MSYKDADYVLRLDSHGWVEIYEPQIRRRDFTDQADGPLEFLQGESYESYRFRYFGEINAESMESKHRALLGGRPKNETNEPDIPNDPWPWEY